MDYMRIGKLARLMQEHAKQTAKQLNTTVPQPFTNQKEVLKTLNRLLGFPEADSLLFFDSNKTSGIFSGDIDLKIDKVDILQEQDISQAIEQIKERLTIYCPHDTYFSKRHLCADILAEFSLPTEAISRYRANPNPNKEHRLELDRLREYDMEKQYDDFLAYVIFYLATYVYNKVTIPEELRKLQSDCQNLGQETLDYLVTNRYYKRYDKRTFIIPHLDKGLLEIQTTINFISPYINPVNSEKNKWQLRTTFATESLRASHQVTSLIINGKDYSQAVTSTLSLDNIKKYPYIKHYEVDNIPPQDFYHVILTTTSYRSSKYFQTAVRLQAPCLDYNLQVEIRGANSELYNLGFQFFSTYDHQKAPNVLTKEIYGRTAQLHIPQLLPLRTGHLITVRPKPEHIADLCSIEELQAALEKKLNTNN